MTTVVFADTNNNRFIALTFTSNITSELKGKTVESSDMLGVYAGIKNLISKEIGVYIGFDARIETYTLQIAAF